MVGGQVVVRRGSGRVQSIAFEQEVERHLSSLFVARLGVEVTVPGMRHTGNSAEAALCCGRQVVVVALELAAKMKEAEGIEPGFETLRVVVAAGLPVEETQGSDRSLRDSALQVLEALGGW